MLLLDMDGVLTDFIKQALPLFGKPIDFPIVHPSMEVPLGITAEEFWATIDAAGEDFWATMPDMPECDAIIDMVSNTGIKWLISTSPSRSPHAASGKMKWMRRKFGSSFNSFMIGSHKYAMSHPGNILVDDFEKNIKKFITKSEDVPNPGRGILVPRPWNKLGVLKPDCDVVKFIETNITL